MREFQDKKRFRRILYSKTTLVVLLILMVFLAKAVWSVYLKDKESARNTVMASNELAQLQARHDFLTQELGRLKTAEGKEEEIRKKYQVSKPGEQVVVIVEATASLPVQIEEAGTLQKAWDSIVHIFKKRE